jgi:hypothetical protein
MAVGRSLDPDARRAGAEAARSAVRRDDAKLLVVFAAIGHDPAAVLAGIADVAPGVPLIGCSTNGELATGGPKDGTVVVTAIGGPGISASTGAVEGISGRQRAAGAEVAERASAPTDREHRVLILLTDGLAREQENVLRGAYGVLGATVPLFGGAAADSRRIKETFQLHGTDVLHNGVVAASLSSDAPLGIGISHGWRKAGDAMIVTHSDDERVYTLDGKPALDVFLERLGAPPEVYHDAAAFSRWSLTRPLGVQRRSGVEVRNISHDVDFAGRSIGGGGEVFQGALIWAMEGDADSVLAATEVACRDAVAALDGNAPLGLLTLSCAGCRAVLGDDGIQQESARIEAEAKGAPFAGFYTYGEIARTRGIDGLHNQTLVVLALA